MTMNLSSLEQKKPLVGKKFRMQAKNWFLTFPQCAVTKEQALEAIISKLITSVKGVIVAQEKHADGENHLHIAIFLHDKLRTSSPEYWDFVCGKHGNYQSLKSIKGTIAYLKKEDTQPLIYGTIPEPSSDSSTPKSDTAATMIQSGSNLEQLNKEMPGFFMLNKRKIEEYSAWCSMKKQQESIKPLKLPILYTGEQTVTARIIEWLNMNLLTTRPFKQKQLYISSPPNHFKTSLINKLETHLRIYHMPLLEDFYDFYDDDQYDLVVLDEFKGQKTIQFLNLFLQGGIMNIRVKCSQKMKKKNLPMIILSNYELHNVYKDAFKIAPLSQRLIEINLTEPLDIDNITIETKTEFQNNSSSSISQQEWKDLFTVPGSP